MRTTSPFLSPTGRYGFYRRNRSRHARHLSAHIAPPRPVPCPNTERVRSNSSHHQPGRKCHGHGPFSRDCLCALLIFQYLHNVSCNNWRVCLRSFSFCPTPHYYLAKKNMKKRTPFFLPENGKQIRSSSLTWQLYSVYFALVVRASFSLSLLCALQDMHTVGISFLKTKGWGVHYYCCVSVSLPYPFCLLFSSCSLGSYFLGRAAARLM